MNFIETDKENATHWQHLDKKCSLAYEAIYPIIEMLIAGDIHKFVEGNIDGGEDNLISLEWLEHNCMGEFLKIN